MLCTIKTAKVLTWLDGHLLINTDDINYVKGKKMEYWRVIENDQG